MRKLLFLILFVVACTQNPQDLIGKKFVLTTIMKQIPDSSNQMNNYKISDSIITIRFYHSGYVYINSKLNNTIYTSRYTIDSETFKIMDGIFEGEYVYTLKNNELSFSKIDYIERTQNILFYFEY